MALDLSVVVPLYNEAPNVNALCAALRAALDPTEMNYEVLLVDDGSDDATPGLITKEAEADSRFVSVPLDVNRGQARALTAGFRRSKGAIVASLDADLQNDPADLPALIADVREGADAACGYRRFRHDDWLGKLLPSLIFNALLRRLFGVPVHDNSCTLRAYRGEVARSLDLAFDDLSFIPVMLHLRGLTVVERFARHHPRLAGTAKYDSPRRFVYTLRKMIRLWREKRTIQRPKSELD